MALRYAGVRKGWNSWVSVNVLREKNATTAAACKATAHWQQRELFAAHRRWTSMVLAQVARTQLLRYGSRHFLDAQISDRFCRWRYAIETLGCTRKALDHAGRRVALHAFGKWRLRARNRRCGVCLQRAGRLVFLRSLLSSGWRSWQSASREAARWDPLVLRGQMCAARHTSIRACRAWAKWVALQVRSLQLLQIGVVAMAAWAARKTWNTWRESTELRKSCKLYRIQHARSAMDFSFKRLWSSWCRSWKALTRARKAPNETSECIFAHRRLRVWYTWRAFTGGHVIAAQRARRAQAWSLRLSLTLGWRRWCATSCGICCRKNVAGHARSSSMVRCLAAWRDTMAEQRLELTRQRKAWQVTTRRQQCVAFGALRIHAKTAWHMAIALGQLHRYILRLWYSSARRALALSQRLRSGCLSMRHPVLRVHLGRWRYYAASEGRILRAARGMMIHELAFKFRQWRHRARARSLATGLCLQGATVSLRQQLVCALRTWRSIDLWHDQQLPLRLASQRRRVHYCWTRLHHMRLAHTLGRMAVQVANRHLRRSSCSHALSVWLLMRLKRAALLEALQRCSAFVWVARLAAHLASWRHRLSESSRRATLLRCGLRFACHSCLKWCWWHWQAELEACTATSAARQKANGLCLLFAGRATALAFATWRRTHTFNMQRLAEEVAHISAATHSLALRRACESLCMWRRIVSRNAVRAALLLCARSHQASQALRWALARWLARWMAALSRRWRRASALQRKALFMAHAEQARGAQTPSKRRSL